MFAPVATCQIILTDNKGEHFFSSGNIIRIEAADNYTIIYFKDNRWPFVVSKVLKVYEEMLSPYGFVRTNRSQLVNKQYIIRVNRNNVTMQGSTIATITRRRRNICMNQLKYKFYNQLMFLKMIMPILIIIRFFLIINCSVNMVYSYYGQ